MTLRRQRRPVLLEPRRAFSDSSAYLALINPHDTYHQQAHVILTRLTEQRWRTYTTNFVIAETHALFIIRLGNRRATEFLRQIRQTSTTILRVTRQDEQLAEEIIFSYQDKIFSFTDATSLAVMERLNIPYAFTGTSPNTAWLFLLPE